MLCFNWERECLQQFQTPVRSRSKTIRSSSLPWIHSHTASNPFPWKLTDYTNQVGRANDTQSLSVSWLGGIRKHLLGGTSWEWIRSTNPKQSCTKRGLHKFCAPYREDIYLQQDVHFSQSTALVIPGNENNLVKLCQTVMPWSALNRAEKREDALMEPANATATWRGRFRRSSWPRSKMPK